VCPDQAEKPSSQVAINRAILIGVLALSALLYACAKSPSANVRGDAAHPTPVHFYTVAEETAKRRVQAVGSLFALEESILSSQVEGRVSQVLADVGDTVKEEQALIVLDPQELQFEVDRQRGLVHQVRAQLGVGPSDQPPTDPKMIAITDQATTLNYRSAAQFNNSWNVNLHYRAALSYITGSHAYKVGFNNAWGHHDNQTYALNPISYTFFAGVPSAVTLRATPYTQQVDVNADLGIFAQDKWTHNHLTMSYGVRYDRFKNSFPEQTLEPGPLTPNRNVTYARRDNLNWHDITPKSSLTYELFGNGKTALKLSMNKYLTGYGTFAIGGNNRCSLWGQRRYPAIGRVDNQRRARAKALHGHEHRIVAARDVGLAAARRTCVPGEHRRAFLV